MNNTNNIDLKQLEILILELQQNEKKYENITFEELEKLYQARIKKEYTQNKVDTPKKETSKIESTNEEEKTKTYEQTKKAIKEKIDRLSPSEFTTELAKIIHWKYSCEFIEITMDKKNNRKIKVEKLNELGNRADKSYQELKEIEIKINEIKQKMICINRMYNQKHRFLQIYQSSELLNFKNRINELLQVTDIESSSMLKEFSNLSETLENVILTFNKLDELNIYKRWIYPFNEESYEYNINGIIIRVNAKEKTYEITYDEKLISILKKCKVSKLKKILEQRLKYVPISEIIEPKYVNEKKISELIKNNNIHLEEILKFDINGLIRYLSLDGEMKNSPSIKELSEINEDMKKVCELLQILKTQGFETYIGKEKIIFEYIINKYHSINLASIEDIYEQITPTFYKQYSNEIFIYSSLQGAYNCIDIHLRKAMHEDLSNNKTKEESENIKQVIEFMKKFSRNKDGKQYPDDEIINFLKQKNSIVNTKFKPDNDDFEDYKDSINVSDVNTVLYKLTGRRR